MKLESIIKLLKGGKVGVIPTDTIYGIVGSALNPQAVEEIYRLRKRSFNKPMIILTSDLNDLNHFNISLSEKQMDFLKKVWPSPLSVVLVCQDDKFSYLHRGTKTLAFRMPKDEWLLSLLKQTGPLIAPSANFEGEKPAENISEAKKYFGEDMAFYVDGGEVKSIPSTLIKLHEDGEYEVLRKGVFKNY